MFGVFLGYAWHPYTVSSHPVDYLTCPPLHTGASGQNRTDHTGIFSPMLYLLSYRGIILEVSAGLEPATSSLPRTCTANCATRPWRFRQDSIPTRRPFKSPPGNFSSPVFTFTTETYESFYLHSQDRATLNRPHRTVLPCFVHKLKGSGDYPIIGVELPAKTHHFAQAYGPYLIYTGY